MDAVSMKRAGGNFMRSSHVTCRGQVTIPKPIRELLSIKEGDYVRFVPQPDGRVVLEVGGYDVRELRGVIKPAGKGP
jgi:AbrB family looped-hinge helix DNA binding protein